MKILVEFDLTCPSHEALYQELRARMHALETGLEKPKVEEPVQQSTKLGSDIQEHPEVTLDEVRAAIKQAAEIDNEWALRYMAQLPTLFNVVKLSDCDGSQLATIKHAAMKVVNGNDVLLAF